MQREHMYVKHIAGAQQDKAMFDSYRDLMCLLRLAIGTCTRGWEKRLYREKDTWTSFFPWKGQSRVGTNKKFRRAEHSCDCLCPHSRSDGWVRQASKTHGRTWCGQSSHRKHFSFSLLTARTYQQNLASPFHLAFEIVNLNSYIL